TSRYRCPTRRASCTPVLSNGASRSGRGCRSPIHRPIRRRNDPGSVPDAIAGRRKTNERSSEGVFRCLVTNRIAGRVGTVWYAGPCSPKHGLEYQTVPPVTIQQSGLFLHFSLPHIPLRAPC